MRKTYGFFSEGERTPAGPRITAWRSAMSFVAAVVPLLPPRWLSLVHNENTGPLAQRLEQRTHNANPRYSPAFWYRTALDCQCASHALITPEPLQRTTESARNVTAGPQSLPLRCLQPLSAVTEGQFWAGILISTESLWPATTTHGPGLPT